jgi:ATP-binding cassette subfamily C (CFTR/MRP) protein 1
MSSALTFAVFAIISAATHDRGLLVAQAFTSLSLISLLTYPLNQLVQAAPQLLACSACFSRIEQFLEQPEKDGMRELDFETRESNDSRTYLHEDPEKEKQKDQDGNAHVNLPTSAVSIRDASFAWSPSASPVLHNVNLEIPTHSIEVLCGPVGSGKSTLIHGILGNARRTAGSLYIISGSSSYCGQVSWLMSGTIRDNITAGSAFDDQWYRYTLWVCSLDSDLLQLRRGDLTEVGSNGTALSGGQKQRVVSSCSSTKTESVA